MDNVTETAIRQHLHTATFGRELQVVDVLPSTNATARELAQQGAPEGTVVVAAAQLNRDNAKTNRRPQLSDLRESGSIEQDANVVIFVHDDGTPPDQFGGRRIELIIAKNRQGQRGTIRTVFRGGVMRFAEVT